MIAIRTPPSITGCLHAQKEESLSSAAIADLEALSQQAKSRHLRGRSCWSLDLIARDPSYHGPPVTGRLIVPFIEQARKENHIVWLDASNPHARDVYLELGFRIAEELKVGEGRCSESGDLVQGGTGISVWSMMMDPRND